MLVLRVIKITNKFFHWTLLCLERIHFFNLIDNENVRTRSFHGKMVQCPKQKIYDYESNEKCAWKFWSHSVWIKGGGKKTLTFTLMLMEEPEKVTFTFGDIIKVNNGKDHYFVCQLHLRDREYFFFSSMTEFFSET